jgi:hypothetical protein
MGCSCTTYRDRTVHQQVHLPLRLERPSSRFSVRLRERRLLRDHDALTVQPSPQTRDTLTNRLRGDLAPGLRELRLQGEVENAGAFALCESAVPDPPAGLATTRGAVGATNDALNAAAAGAPFPPNPDEGGAAVSPDRRNLSSDVRQISLELISHGRTGPGPVPERVRSNSSSRRAPRSIILVQA